MAPVVRELGGADPTRAETIVCATGQHREMLDQVIGVRPRAGPRSRPDARGPEPRGLTAGVHARLDDCLRDGVRTPCSSRGTRRRRWWRRWRPLTADPRRPCRGRSADRRPLPTVPRRDQPDDHRLSRGLEFRTDREADSAPCGRAARRPPHPRDRQHGDRRSLRILGRRARGAAPRFPSPGLRLVLVTAHRRESFGQPFEDLAAPCASRAPGRGHRDRLPGASQPERPGARPAHPGRSARVRLIEPLGYVAFAGS